MSTNNPAAQMNGKKANYFTVCLKFQPRLSYRLSPKEEQMYYFLRSSDAFNCCNNNNNDDDDDDNNDNDNDNNNNNNKNSSFRRSTALLGIRKYSAWSYIYLVKSN